MRGTLTETAFRQIVDDEGAFVHQAADATRATRLRQHVAQARHHQNLADLVLDGRDGFGAKAHAVAGILVDPERAHDRIGDVLPDDTATKAFVDEQAGKHEQRGAGYVEQGAHGIGEDVVEAMAPAIGPDVTKGGHDTVGNDRFKIVAHLREGIETDRPLKVGRVDVDEIVGAGTGNAREHGLRQIPVRVEQRPALAGSQVLFDEVEEERALAGAGLADDVEMPAALLGSEHDGPARYDV